MAFSLHFGVVDKILLFIAAFIDQESRYSDKTAATTVDTMYSDLVNYIMFKGCGVICSSIYGLNLVENSQKVNTLKGEIFENMEDIDLFTLKFYMLEHMVEKRVRFCLASYIGTYHCQHFNFVINKLIRMNSMRKTRSLKEKVKLFNSFTFRNGIIEQKLKSGSKTARVRKIFEERLEDLSTSTYPYLTKIKRVQSWS